MDVLEVLDEMLLKSSGRLKGGNIELFVNRYDGFSLNWPCLLSIARLWYVFNMRDHGSAFLRSEITGTPFLWGTGAM